MNKSPCNSVNDQSSFLWCLLHLHFIKHSLSEVIELVSSIYEQQFEFSSEFENLLLKLWETSDINFLTEIAKQVVKQHLLDVEKHIFVVAALVENGEVSINDAALLLKYDAEKNYANFDEKIKRVIDVAWLIIEDEEDRVMSPSDDNMLDEALKEVLVLYREK